MYRMLTQFERVTNKVLLVQTTRLHPAEVLVFLQCASLPHASSWHSLSAERPVEQE